MPLECETVFETNTGLVIVPELVAPVLAVELDVDYMEIMHRPPHLAAAPVVLVLSRGQVSVQCLHR